MNLTYSFVAKALGTPVNTSSSQPLLDCEIDEFVVDSRRAEPGSVFVAFCGERVDGHDFVVDAFMRGACAAIVERDRLETVRASLGALESEDERLLFPVADTLQALQKLAGQWRRKIPAKVVGVTGSVGKTITKDLIASLLSKRFCVLKSEGNLNNEIGLPLSVLKMRAKHKYAVLEMGMYALGEIATLAEIARPEIGVVTNVGPTHLERLGSIGNIARAKTELIEALPADGLAVLNGDDIKVREMARKARCPVLFYGMGAKCDIRAANLVTNGIEGISFEAVEGTERVCISLPLPGAHSAYGALAAISVARNEGMDWRDIAYALAEASDCTRMRVLKGESLVILDDSYNAAPVSSLAALAVLREAPGRKVAVLGDMLELGEETERGHRRVGREAGLMLGLLVTVGLQARWYAEEAIAAGMAEEAVYSVDDVAQAQEIVLGLIREGDAILIKGSRGMHLDGLAEFILEHFPARRDGGPG